MYGFLYLPDPKQSHSKGVHSVPEKRTIAKNPSDAPYLFPPWSYWDSAHRRTSALSGTELSSVGHGDSMDTIQIIDNTGGAFYKNNVYQS